MAYRVETGSRRYVGVGGVIAVHIALAWLLVAGLAGPGFVEPIKRVLVGEQIPIAPPPPEQKPEAIEEKQAVRDSTITLPPEIPVTISTGTLISLPPLDPVGEIVLDPRPPVTNEQPVVTGLVSPVGAKPLGDVGRWVTASDYPAAPLRRGEQGVTGFRVEIDASGRVTSCSVTASSGSQALDEAACRHVTRRARFAPATDGRGAKVAGSYSNSVRWTLPE